MTLDDDTSIYVGGLPYEASEESLRRAFVLYGTVVAVKIINDQEVGGKCYGFVTFTNPRSAVNAIADMNGRTIGGRVVRVNEVRARGGRPNFRENVRRDDVGWDRERGRERGYSRERDNYRDRNIERSRDRGRERPRDYEHGHEPHRVRDHAFDRDRDIEDHDQERIRDHDQERIRDRDEELLRDQGRERERDHDMDWIRDRDVDKSKSHSGGREKVKEQPARNKLDDRLDVSRSRELSSNSSDDYDDEYDGQANKELKLSIHKRDELQKELSEIQEIVEEKEQLVSVLKKKSEKLEDTLADVKKLSSQRQNMLTKLHKCFLQSEDYAERVKSAQQDLKSLVDTTMTKIDAADDVNTLSGSVYANGQLKF